VPAASATTEATAACSPRLSWLMGEPGEARAPPRHGAHGIQPEPGQGLDESGRDRDDAEEDAGDHRVRHGEEGRGRQYERHAQEPRPAAPGGDAATGLGERSSRKRAAGVIAVAGAAEGR
jgi:hypothetical protein